VNRKILVATVVVAVLAGILIYNSDAMREARFIKSLVARNIETRGGMEAWENVAALRLSGQMDLGQEMIVPYVLEQKRPDKMCFEFEFDGDTARQCTNRDGGWKIAPFLGREGPEPMTESEYREAADSADPYGLLYNYAGRGTSISLAGREMVDGREAYKLELELARGVTRWLYLDVESALELRMETLRAVTGQPRLATTVYSDWREVEGLLIPHRQDTRTEGNPESHFITVESVVVNPMLDDSRFRMPASLNASTGQLLSNAS
jgi:hypothetical protein